MFLGLIFRKKNVRQATETEKQQDSAVRSTENENHTDIVASMTALSDAGAQNSGNSNKEPVYQDIPDES